LHGGYFGRGVKGDVAIRAYLEAKNLSVATADFTMAMERLRTAARPAAAPAATIPVNPQNTANLGFTVGQPQTPQQPNPQACPQPNPQPNPQPSPPPLVYLATGNPLSIELPPELAKKPIGQVIAAPKSEHGSAHNLGHRISLSDSISVALAIGGAHTFSDAEANVISAVMRVRKGFQGRSFCSVI